MRACFHISFNSIDGDMLWLLSCDKCTYCKSLWTKVSAKCSKCKCYIIQYYEYLDNKTT